MNAERDAMDLHTALTEALRRLHTANERFRAIHNQGFATARGTTPDYSLLEPIDCSDLLEVLDRMCRPDLRPPDKNLTRTHRLLWQARLELGNAMDLALGKTKWNPGEAERHWTTGPGGRLLSRINEVLGGTDT